ncbi:hypothetical protein R1flu_003600 [Riccia fluitans]|uniref:Uncharacterized protein n=1 Tax=Riccia fluitans TaxID=41844 RepID=A0ABD1Y9L2_9MARC
MVRAMTLRKELISNGVSLCLDIDESLHSEGTNEFTSPCVMERIILLRLKSKALPPQTQYILACIELSMAVSVLEGVSKW